ncbi:hypothetical protein NBZ79_12120 [Sneathiella marina]|uniref:Uncharacterized protein n=1 Tax=Sneathiella marina TaxID=2950108 RepID=A0ABY4VYC1_9PROT|nr:hypothetical protein [Sneathiella marina]USG59922.1 hypothetical protein NBZ79_12120 [Sneathiella marina]
MSLKYKHKESTDPDRGPDAIIPRGEAEIGLLAASDPEEAANDNAPLLDVVKGAVWRDVQSLQAKAGAMEDGPTVATREDLFELDFTPQRSGMRGFLDEG